MTAPSIAASTRRSYSNLLLTGGLILAVVVFLWQLPWFSRGGGEAFLINIWYHGYVFVWLLLVTALGRTLPLRILAAAFFFGLFLSVAVALAIGVPLGDALGTSNRLFDSVLIPLLEEVIKGLPVLAYFWILTRRGTWQPSMTDGLMLGFLVGAGFAIYEDALVDRSFGSDFGIADLAFIFPTVDDHRLIGEGRSFGFYHAQWSALVGLAIGAAFFFRGRFRLAWLFPIVALAVVWLDHGRVNYVAGELGIAVRSSPTSDVLGSLTLGGRLPVYLLVAGIVAAVVTEVVVRRRMARRDYLFKGISLPTILSWLQSGGVAGLRRVQAAREYIRARRAVHYALWNVGSGQLDPDRVSRMGRMLMTLGVRAGVTFSEPGVEDDPAPSRAPAP